MNVNNEQTANLRHVFVHLTNKSKRFESRGTHQSRCYSDHYIDDECFNYVVDLPPKKIRKGSLKHKE